MGHNWFPSPRAALGYLLAGFVTPYLGPVQVVRYCPGDARFSFPFLFAEDLTAAADLAVLLGISLNTIVGAIVAFAVGSAIRKAPVSASLAAKVARQYPTILSLLGVAALVVLLGLETVSSSPEVWPGHVDTDACRHVRGHAFVPNWWGPTRFDLISLDRFGFG